MPNPRNGQAANSRRTRAACPLGLEVLEERTLLDAGLAGASLDLTGLAANTGSYASSNILVQYRPGTNPAPALAGTTVGPSLPLVANLYEIDLASDVSVATALAAYRADPRVLAAEPDYTLASLGTAAVSPNDPSFSQQWDMKNTGQNAGTAGADIHATQAWAVTTGSYKTVVAVMDTGIDYNHPDLYQNVWINQAEIPKSRLANLTDVDHDGVISFADLNNPVNQGPFKITDVNHDGRIDAADILAPMVLNTSAQDTGAGGWAYPGNMQDGDTAHPNDFVGWNFVANTNNPFDGNGHGTHVSGTIGAVGNNGTGVAGIDWKVSLMPVKFLGSDGSGNIASFILALNYAVAHGAMISNNSWSGADNDTFLYDAINNARQHGQIFVAAAGNGGTNNDVAPTYPAGFPLDNVVSVAATDNHDNLASFSNYGPNTVALGAPGLDILSTTPNNTYSVYSGTSMATPHVTGVLALVWSQHPTWTYQQVINQVLSTVDKVPGLSSKTETGGVVNAGAAVGYVQQATITPMVLGSSASGSSPNTINQVLLTFNEPMAPGSFPTSAIRFTDPTGQLVPVLSLQPVAGSGNQQFLITFPTQVLPGNYLLRVGPKVWDYHGQSLGLYEMIFTIQSTYSYTNGAQYTIPNLGQAVSTLTVNQDITISRLLVTFDIKEPVDGDLYIHLTAPNGTDILLVNARGGSGQNFVGTILDDGAAQPIGLGTAPFVGSYRPEIRLGNLTGLDARGTWTLTAQDTTSGGAGVLQDWALILIPSNVVSSDGASSGRVKIAEADAPASDAAAASAMPSASLSLARAAVSVVPTPPAGQGGANGVGGTVLPAPVVPPVDTADSTPAPPGNVSGAQPVDDVFASGEAMDLLHVTYLLSRRGNGYGATDGGDEV